MTLTLDGARSAHFQNRCSAMITVVIIIWLGKTAFSFEKNGTFWFPHSIS